MSALIRCSSGSGGLISHYYHFFFACLVPLIDWSLSGVTCYLSKDMIHKFGPFKNTLIKDLPLCSIVPVNSSLPNDMNVVYLPPYDMFRNDYYTNSSVPRFDPEVTLPHVTDYFNNLVKSSPRGKRTKRSEKKIILIVERHLEPVSLLFNASSNQSHKYYSGASRRTIRNHKAMVEALWHRYSKRYEVRNVVLEGRSIVEQYSLFNSASLLIAQHGAALANIIFMNRSTSHVIEISPSPGREWKFFSNLASHIGLSYSSVGQAQRKGNVEVPMILQHVDCVLRRLPPASDELPTTEQLRVLMNAQRCGDIVGRSNGSITLLNDNS